MLESLGRISLDAWRTRTAALPQLFAEARIQADKLVEPKTQHVKLGSVTLRTDRGRQGLGEEDRAGTARAAQARSHRGFVGSPMKTLSTEYRRQLERTVIEARDVAEAGARGALEALAVHAP